MTPTSDRLLAVQHHLIARDWRLLGWLYDHRVLTSFQIAHALFPSLNYAQRRLTTLAYMDLVEQFPPFRLEGYDFPLRALDGCGLHIDEMTSLCGMVGDYVASAVRDEIGWFDHARRTGMDRRQWMAEYVGPYVKHVVESGNYPMFNRTIHEGRLSHMSPDARFQYGLNHVLNGIAAALPNATTR